MFIRGFVPPQKGVKDKGKISVLEGSKSGITTRRDDTTRASLYVY